MIEKISEKKCHTFYARYGLVRHLYRISETLYILEGPSGYSRGGEGMADLQGGPYIEVGMPMNLLCDIHTDPGCGFRLREDETVHSVRFLSSTEADLLKGSPTETPAPDSYAWIQIESRYPAP
jgi:hypothetical protein